MKKGWIALALLLAMLLLASWHVVALCALTGELGDALERAEELAEAGDWAAAAQLTGDAQARWEKNQFYLHVTSDHAITDEIAAGFAETLEFIQCQEAGEYSAANARLKARLSLLGEMERPVPENLL